MSTASEFFNNLSEQLNNLPTWAKTAIGVVVVGVPVYAIFCHNKKRKSPIKTDFKHGVVYVYQFRRSPVIPSISPFCLKLETWLRIADINYEVLYKPAFAHICCFSFINFFSAEY